MARPVTDLVGCETSSTGIRKLKTLPNAFEGLVISASGKIPGYEHDEIEEMVEECGAKFEKWKVSDCTHLITTPGCYHSEEATTKITKARRSPNCDIVSIDWLLGSIKKKKPLNTRGFLIRALGSKRLAPATTGGNAKSNLTSNLKRKPTTGSSDEEGQRAKISNNRVLANRDKFLPLVDQASHEEAYRKNLLVWIDEDDVIWDVTLVEESSASDKQTKSEITSTSAKIIRIQLIVETEADKYNTCIRETKMTRQRASGIQQPGSINSTVSRKGNGRLSGAITEFETAFKQLSGLAWSQRSEGPKEGKAIFLQLASKNAQEKLDSAVSEVLSKFIELQNFAATKVNLLETYPNKLLENTNKHVDHSLDTAISLLEKLSSVRNSASPSAKALATNLSQCFFALFWPAGKALPAETQWIKQSRRSIEDLKHSRAIESAPKNFGQPDPVIMRHVLDLLHMEAMTPVKTSAQEYKLLAEYFQNSSGWHLVSISNIFQLEREGEAQQFAQWRNCHQSAPSERRLVWHGSHVLNFASILRHGLRIGPTRGIFFADWSLKSIAYCDIQRGEEAFMLLCEVELGSSDGVSLNVQGPENLMISYIIKGLTHKTWRDAASVHSNLRGVKIPKVIPGRTRQDVVSCKEYVIMDPAQVRQRYLFHFRLT